MFVKPNLKFWVHFTVIQDFPDDMTQDNMTMALYASFFTKKISSFTIIHWLI